MQRSAQRMQALINELLVLSRINRRGEPFVRVDLGQVVRDMLQDLDERIAQSGAEVRIDDLPTIDADPTQMRQLFQNLIANALKFRRSDQPPRVVVRGRMPKARQDGAALGRRSCEIEVVDNGIGFEQRYAEQIFQPFQRLHGRSEFEGTGMGLTICRKIAERHGGTIVARGVPGEGSTFLVTLPLTQSTGGPSDGQ
jgi:signal transduction histidine kinase